MSNKVYNFKSEEELDTIIDCVLGFYTNFVPDGVDYKPLLDYKRRQVYRLLDGKVNITPQELMMYLSCPLEVQDRNDITHFGIRTIEFPYNGKMNSFLSDSILKSSLVYSLSVEGYSDEEINIIDRVNEPMDNTLPNKDDILSYYASSMLTNTSLLLYLFLTGNGEEFTRVFNDNGFLKKLESGNFIEEEITSRIDRSKSNEHEFDEDFKKLYKEDLKIIRKDMEKTEIPPEETFGFRLK